MRPLILLALVTLATFPLSAHDHWRGPRRVVVIESPRCAPPRTWDECQWDNRYEHRYERRYERRYEHGGWSHHDCNEGRVVFRPMPRPLELPFEGRIELRLR